MLSARKEVPEHGITLGRAIGLTLGAAALGYLAGTGISHGLEAITHRPIENSLFGTFGNIGPFKLDALGTVFAPMTAAPLALYMGAIVALGD